MNRFWNICLAIFVIAFIGHFIFGDDENETPSLQESLVAQQRPVDQQEFINIFNKYRTSVSIAQREAKKLQGNELARDRELESALENALTTRSKELCSLLGLKKSRFSDFYETVEGLSHLYSIEDIALYGTKGINPVYNWTGFVKDITETKYGGANVVILMFPPNSRFNLRILTVVHNESRDDPAFHGLWSTFSKESKAFQQILALKQNDQVSFSGKFIKSKNCIVSEGTGHVLSKSGLVFVLEDVVKLKSGNAISENNSSAPIR